MAGEPDVHVETACPYGRWFRHDLDLSTLLDKGYQNSQVYSARSKREPRDFTKTRGFMRHAAAMKTETVVTLQAAGLSIQDKWWRPLLSTACGIEGMIDRMLGRVEKGI